MNRMIMHSGKRCHKKCEAYQVAYAAAEKLYAQRNELTASRQNYESLLSLIKAGYLILGIQVTDLRTVATVAYWITGAERCGSMKERDFAERVDLKRESAKS